MVGVEVDDQYPLAGVGESSGGDGHVVEQAEAHGPFGCGVVARWANRDKGRVGLSCSQPLDRIETGPGRHDGGIPGLRSGGGVGVYISAARPAEALEGVNEFGGVHPD
jgi:hypothetical protein